MRKTEERFGRPFAAWVITLPPEDVKARRRGKIVGAGWAIWCLFDTDGGANTSITTPPIA